MAAVLKRPPLYRRPEEIGRRVIGSLLEFGIKAHGAAAAVTRRRRSTRKPTRNSRGTSNAGSERNRPPRRGLSWRRDRARS